MNTMSEKVKKIMAAVIDCSITREMAMEVLRVKYDWLYPYVTNGVWDEHYGLYLKSKGLLFETKCGCVIQRNSREHDECRCDEDGENWICAGCYSGEYDEEEAEPEWNPNGIKIKDDDSGLCNVCNKWQPICKFQEGDIIKQPCKECFPSNQLCRHCEEKPILRSEEETKYTCEECGTHDEDEVGISTGANGIEKRVCECCDIDGSNYSGWGEDK